MDPARNSWNLPEVRKASDMFAKLPKNPWNFGEARETYQTSSWSSENIVALLSNWWQFREGKKGKETSSD